jgi:heme-degrading monooxygenase HmoA
MFARVSTFQAQDTEHLLRSFAGVTDSLERIEGFSHAYFLVSRESGKGLSVTFWDSEDDLFASSEIAAELRTRASQDAGATIESVEEYDVGLFTSSPETVDGRTYRHHRWGTGARPEG